MSRGTMTRRELLDAAHADAREALRYLLHGVSVCGACGAEEETCTMDAVSPLREAVRRLARLKKAGAR